MGRDCTHVPDHEGIAIQVGSGYQQQTTFCRFGGNGSQQLIGDEAIHQLAQRLAPKYADAKERAYPVRLQDPFGGRAGEGMLQRPISLSAEEGQGGDERSRAHARNDLELRPCALPAPSDQHAGAERAPGTSTRQGEQV